MNNEQNYTEDRDNHLRSIHLVFYIENIDCTEQLFWISFNL